MLHSLYSSGSYQLCLISVELTTSFSVLVPFFPGLSCRDSGTNFRDWAIRQNRNKIHAGECEFRCPKWPGGVSYNAQLLKLVARVHSCIESITRLIGDCTRLRCDPCLEVCYQGDSDQWATIEEDFIGGAQIIDRFFTKSCEIFHKGVLIFQSGRSFPGLRNVSCTGSSWWAIVEAKDVISMGDA